MSRITIVSGIQLSANPRVVKEAEALTNAGHDVTVLGATLDRALVSQDLALTSGKRWNYQVVLDATSRDPGFRMAWLKSRVRRRLWREAQAHMGVSRSDQAGYAGRELLAACLQDPADFYIVHNPQSMWVGVQLLRRGFAVGVDMEDWYSRDVSEDDEDSISAGMLEGWERTLLMDGAYATTTSNVMSNAIASVFDCNPPAVVYNGFSVRERGDRAGYLHEFTEGKLPALVWLSQVIGPGRGLETLVDSLAGVTVPFTINLLGRHDSAYIASLLERAPVDWQSRIRFHHQVPQHELVPFVRVNDLAFAGELPTRANTDLTISNKILLYLLAGVPVIGTDTKGHQEIAAEAPGAVTLFAAGDPSSLANALNTALADRDSLFARRASATNVAERMYCWERSAPVLVDQVERALLKGNRFAGSARG